MKRFHIHVSVKDIDQSIRFYSQLFGAAPSVVKSDYAKWLLDDPRVNVAISNRDSALGINHVGLQVESAAELAQLETQLQQADGTVIPESGVTCCYAKSDKYWVTDPQGVAWEVFHTLEDAPLYGPYRTVASLHSAEDAACCTPSARDPQRTTGTACC